MQGANLFHPCWALDQSLLFSSRGRCEGLLKHLADRKVLRQQVVNSASFLLMNLRQCFPTKPKLMIQPEHLQEQSLLHTAKAPPPPIRRGSYTTPDLSPSSDETEFPPFPLTMQSTTKILFKNFQSLKNGKVWKGWKTWKKGVAVLSIKNASYFFAAGVTIRNQWLIHPGLQECPLSTLPPPPTDWLEHPFMPFLC